jgi:hypothetical protein
VIEGVGRNKADSKLALQALGLISFDDEKGTYKMRAFNDGRWLETEVKLADGGNSISWEFALAEFKTRTVMRINENGEWTELGELIIGDRPPQKMMDLKVRRSSGPNSSRSIGQRLGIPTESFPDSSGDPWMTRDPRSGS